MARRPSFGGYEEERFEHEVDSKLLCPICSNVLKDPVQCQNEHYFCRSCIKKHLHENSETCPMCQDHLTQETLSKPPRLLTNMLECLKIRCEHAKRGCRELIKLEFLHQHVKSCGYSPTRCTNSGCFQVINQHEKERHEPRYQHGCNIIDNQAVIVGGKTSEYLTDNKNTVYVYDIKTNKCKTLPPLPFRISKMATVSYKGNVILIGGVNEKCETLNTVVMYDVKTGNIKMLPCLNHKRMGSAAVICGNVIVVAGGYDSETKSYLQSVECLDLNTNVWRELAPMTTKRGHANAVLKPV